MNSANQIHPSSNVGSSASKSNKAANAASTNAQFAPRAAFRKRLSRIMAGHFVFIFALWCMFINMVGGCGIGIQCSGGNSADGTIVITSVKAVAAQEGDCTPDPVRVLGDFTANYGEIVTNVEVGSGLSRAWVESVGLTVGSRHPANYESACGSITIDDIKYDSMAEREPVPCTMP